jgi:serine/threonine-protein kinase
MLRDLTGVARALDAGRTSEAAERFAEFRDRVSELRADGQLAGVTLPGLDEITAYLGAG